MTPPCHTPAHAGTRKPPGDGGIGRKPPPPRLDPHTRDVAATGYPRGGVPRTGFGDAGHRRSEQRRRRGGL